MIEFDLQRYDFVEDDLDPTFMYEDPTTICCWVKYEDVLLFLLSLKNHSGDEVLDFLECLEDANI